VTAPLLLTAAAWADNHARAESMVVGAAVVVTLGGSPRVGFGVDASYEYQRFWSRLGEVDGRSYAWAQESLDQHWGPAAHVWWVGGEWSSSVGMMLGAQWPLRIGLEGGWWPGPGLGAEVGVAMSTAGRVGLDLVAVADAPWVRGRLAATLDLDGPHAARIAVGPTTPTRPPENWPDSLTVWDPDRTPPE
jgi:hypothetical protein